MEKHKHRGLKTEHNLSQHHRTSYKKKHHNESLKKDEMMFWQGKYRPQVIILDYLREKNVFSKDSLIENNLNLPKQVVRYALNKLRKEKKIVLSTATIKDNCHWKNKYWGYNHEVVA